MSMMSEIDEYVRKYEVGELGKEELIRILNKSILEISRGILESREVKEVKVVKEVKEVKELKEKKNKSESQRYKSKKAEEYALEHGISMEEFEMLEISKKDVEEKVREMTKREGEVSGSGSGSKSKKSSKKNEEEKKEEEKKEIIKRERVICSGINKKGEGCKSVGTICPEGAKKKYCFRHAEDFRSFECESDSSDEEEELKEEELKEESYD